MTRPGRAAEAQNRPVRVLMVAHRFPPFTGGVETHTRELSRRVAADDGFEVQVLTTDLSRDLPPREVVDGVRVVRVPAGPPGSDLYIAPEIYRRVRSTTADLVHCQGYHTFVPPLAMAAARRARLPYVVTLHSGGHSSRIRRAIRPAQLNLLRRQLAGAERLIAVSRFEATDFSRRLGLPAERFAVIPNGSDIPEPERAEPVAREPGLILSVGRLERYKGHHRLIEALPLVRERHPDARILVLGSGPYRRALRDQANASGVDHAVEIRSASRADLSGLLARAQVVALLSDYESQGLAIHEALALGCRIVVSRGTALAEVADLPQAVAVEQSADSEEIARALLIQLEASADRVEPPQLPSWDECASRVMAIYRAVLSGAEPPSAERESRTS